MFTAWYCGPISPPQKKEDWGRGRKTENCYLTYHQTETLTRFDAVPAKP